MQYLEPDINSTLSDVALVVQLQDWVFEQIVWIKCLNSCGV